MDRKDRNSLKEFRFKVYSKVLFGLSLLFFIAGIIWFSLVTFLQEEDIIDLLWIVLLFSGFWILTRYISVSEIIIRKYSDNYQIRYSNPFFSIFYPRRNVDIYELKEVEYNENGKYCIVNLILNNSRPIKFSRKKNWKKEEELQLFLKEGR